MMTSLKIADLQQDAYTEGREEGISLGMVRGGEVYWVALGDGAGVDGKLTQSHTSEASHYTTKKSVCLITSRFA